jgi:hypothetical protein
VTVVVDAVFSMVSAGVCVAVTVTWVDVAVTGVVEPAGTADAVAVSLIVPLSRSACVTEYVPLQVTEAVGASVPDGQVMVAAVAGETALSTTVGVATVTLPVFVTTTEYVMVWPTAFTVVGEALFVTEIEGDCVAVTVTWDDVAVTGVVEVTGVADAVAVSLIEPVSMSACVTV